MDDVALKGDMFHVKLSCILHATREFCVDGTWPQPAVSLPDQA